MQGKQTKPTKVESRFIKLRELNTHYLVGGKGPSLILIHGVSTTAEEAWADNLQPLTQHYRVYAPDLIGYGRSDKPKADYTLPFFTAFLEDFVEALGLEKLSLIGHSAGGGIAIAFALNHPDKVQKLVLIDSSGIKDDTSLWGKLLIPFFTMKAILRKDETYLSMVRNKEKNPKAFHDTLSEIKAPTLIVWARGDKYLPVKQAYEAHKLIKNSRLSIFEHSWHAPHKEYPEEFNRLVLDFLNSG
jgi:4,5:9,10-diseco-3-hydroxy-5,9,17-trioxoandrosta-1(10),2-diene-4-oate hydrolase